MSQTPPPATPEDAFAPIRRSFVLDTPDRLPEGALRADLRFQGTPWRAALDPTAPVDPRLHLFLRQPLWAMDAVPARRRLLWTGVANLPLLGPLPQDPDALAAAAAWHLERGIGPTARRRAEILSLAAGLEAARLGLPSWSLDLPEMTLAEGGLLGAFAGRRIPCVLSTLPAPWRLEASLLLGAEREGTRGGHERLVQRRLLEGAVPQTAHARQAARLRLRALLAREGLPPDLLK